MALKDSFTNLKKDLAVAVQDLPNIVKVLQRGFADAETQAGAVDTDISGLKADVADIKNVMADNAGAHNAIYRGKNLGTAVTSAQFSAIQAGTFDDMYIGDYWEIGSVKWRIAHFDYWLGTGDVECTDHHVVIVPDTNLYNAAMNAENTTTGGYYSSAMRGGSDYLVEDSSALYEASEMIKTNFGATHILTHRELLTNTVTSGNASGWAWYDSSVEIMSEEMAYGTLVWTSGGKGYEIGNGKEQFALFRHNNEKLTNRNTWWMRGIAISTSFANITGDGRPYYSGATNNNGVRPVFAIKGNTETRKPIPPSDPDER